MLEELLTAQTMDSTSWARKGNNICLEPKGSCLFPILI